MSAAGISAAQDMQQVIMVDSYGNTELLSIVRQRPNAQVHAIVALYNKTTARSRDCCSPKASKTFPERFAT